MNNGLENAFPQADKKALQLSRYNKIMAYFYENVDKDLNFSFDNLGDLTEDKFTDLLNDCRLSFEDLVKKAEEKKVTIRKRNQRIVELGMAPAEDGDCYKFGDVTFSYELIEELEEDEFEKVFEATKNEIESIKSKRAMADDVVIIVDPMKGGAKVFDIETTDSNLLINFAKALQSVPVPQIDTEAGTELLDLICEELNELADSIIQRAGNLDNNLE